MGWFSNLLGVVGTTFKVGKATFDASTLSVNRSLTVQNVAGTLALLSDIVPSGNALLYSNTTVPAGNTVANTTTETTLSSTFTMLANSITVGDVIDIDMHGVYSTHAVPPTITVKLKFGSTVMLNSGALTAVAGVTNAGWWGKAKFVVQAVGASGSIEAQGYGVFATAATTGLSTNVANTAPVTIDTTANMVVTMTVTWSTANAANTITLRQFSGEKKHPSPSPFAAIQTYTPSAGGTATLDLGYGVNKIHHITMPAGNITVAISNAVVGQPFTVRILQDGTGSRTVTWFTTIKWAGGGTAPTLTTTANKADNLGFIVTGTNTYDGYVVGQNI